MLKERGNILSRSRHRNPSIMVDPDRGRALGKGSVLGGDELDLGLTLVIQETDRIEHNVKEEIVCSEGTRFCQDSTG